MIRRAASDPVAPQGSNDSAAIIAGETALAAAFAEIAADIDRSFDLLLTVPDCSRGRLIEAMRYAAIGGGKRLRPLLLTSVASLLGADRDAAIRAATAVESIHIYSLIHDDLPAMDNDDLRHGKPTLHRAYDEATAILAGDALHDLAFEILASPADFPDPFHRAEMVYLLAKAAGAGGMAGGQMMDIAGEKEQFDLDTIARLQHYKTGALLSASVEIGAVLGGLPPEGRVHLNAYAQNLGLAFQIADDLLDAEGDAALAGKALRKDGPAGKQSFVTALGADRAREQAKLLIEQAIAHLGSYGEEAEPLRQIARFVGERDH